jgi:hypothetical protein
MAPQVSLELSWVNALLHGITNFNRPIEDIVRLSNCCDKTVRNMLKTYKDYKSNWALHIYNALKMYQKNGTKEFLARHATPDLMQHIRVLAQQRDGSKLEQNHRNQLAAHAKRVAGKKS